MYKRSKTDNRFFLDITKPGNLSPAKMPKSLQKKSSSTTKISRPNYSSRNNRLSITKSSSDENKKWKKTDEWRPLW